MSSDNLSMQEKNEIMSSRLNNNINDVIEKFNTMSDKGMKINNQVMSYWASIILMDNNNEIASINS